ncbi:autotransporter outer membrane beta-barrel domain-containing protein [Plesiomonas sp.]|uniref:autotransporter outer membrane beta-barrel domain-containing protein n=1 Tax=Plesiomonas sp. TaxID=2486279 RepID=UPI003F352F8E
MNIAIYMCVLLCILLCGQVYSQDQTLSNAVLRKRVNAAASLLSFTVVPDVTTSNLSVSSGEANDSVGMAMTQFGGGATLSRDFPLYVEGNMGYSRYDPRFVVTSGDDRRTIPFRWNAFSAAGGVGWDISLRENWVLRPIFTVSLGTVMSDVLIGRLLINNRTDLNLSFLDGGQIGFYGYGGSLMLDYEYYSDAYDMDFETRYSNVRLEAFNGDNKDIAGGASAEQFNLYFRTRIPTGFFLFERPLRTVLETVHTEYLDEQRGALGFGYLTSVGLGIEVDSSKYDIFVSRTRLVARYIMGNNTTGYSLGLAISF